MQRTSMKSTGEAECQFWAVSQVKMVTYIQQFLRALQLGRMLPLLH